MKFAVGRYYFDSLFRDLANSSFIEDVTKKEPFITDNKFQYALGDFQFEVIDDHSLLRGIFGRMKNSDISEVYNKETKEFKKSIVSGIVDKKLEFIISHPQHLIFIEYDKTFLPEHFAKKFQEIFKHTSSIAGIEIDFILDEKDVYKELATWSRVEKITFKKLRPSNPSSLDTFEEIEKLIKETNSSKTKLEFQATEEKNGKPANDSGLNTDSTLIKQSLALSASGYGEADLLGEKDGKEVEVSTVKFIKKVEVNFNEVGAIEKITQVIEEIQKNENKN